MLLKNLSKDTHLPYRNLENSLVIKFQLLRKTGERAKGQTISIFKLSGADSEIYYYSMDKPEPYVYPIYSRDKYT